jgi:hypothetical protein
MPDFLALEFFVDDTGTFDLTSSGVNDNFQTCGQCVLVYSDVLLNEADRFYFQSAGTITVDSEPGPFSGGLNATLTDVRLREVTINEYTYLSEPVPEGGCLLLDGPLDIDIVAD